MRVARGFWDMLGAGNVFNIMIKVWFFFMFMPSVLFMGVAFWVSALKEMAS